LWWDELTERQSQRAGSHGAVGVAGPNAEGIDLMSKLATDRTNEKLIHSMMICGEMWLQRTPICDRGPLHGSDKAPTGFLKLSGE
jgi:hypothetical protein